MRNFLVTTTLFLTPIVLVIIYVLTNYNPNEGDLRRMSYLSINYNYSTVFKDLPENEHIVISVNDSITKNKWKFFTIGDSFFQQTSFSIVNHLSHTYPNDVLDFNRSLLQGDNVLYTLQGLINSDYFDSLEVEYIIFERVERYLIQDAYYYNKERIISWEDIQEKKSNRKQINSHKKTKKEPYPTDRFVKFPLNNLAYLFKPNGLNQDVYKEKLTKPLFSTDSQDVLFYYEDIENLETKNNPEKSRELNTIFNEMHEQLKKKDIQLIVMIYPDKYNMYFDYLEHQSDYERPLFFHNFNALDKDYEYINIYEILKQAVDAGEKDVYLYDDTHTSQKATKLILKELMNR